MVSNEIYLLPPNREDIEYICANLRKVDVVEMRDAGKDPVEWLTKAFDDGEVVCIARTAKEPFAAFCVARTIDYDSAMTPKRYCWLNATDTINNVGVGALRKALYNVDDVVRAFGHIYSYCRDDNPRAHRFLQALGFRANGAKVLFNGKSASYYERIF